MDIRNAIETKVISRKRNVFIVGCAIWFLFLVCCTSTVLVLWVASGGTALGTKVTYLNEWVGLPNAKLRVSQLASTSSKFYADKVWTFKVEFESEGNAVYVQPSSFVLVNKNTGRIISYSYATVKEPRLESTQLSYGESTEGYISFQTDENIGDGSKYELRYKFNIFNQSDYVVINWGKG